MSANASSSAAAVRPVAGDSHLGDRVSKPESKQNWVLDPIQDSLLIIWAPLIVLALALVVFTRFDAATATSLILGAHIVMTVAHHLPTFIRIYGDVDLFKRFRWNFVLAPL